MTVEQIIAWLDETIAKQKELSEHYEKFKNEGISMCGTNDLRETVFLYTGFNAITDALCLKVHRQHNYYGPGEDRLTAEYNGVTLLQLDYAEKERR